MLRQTLCQIRISSAKIYNRSLFLKYKFFQIIKSLQQLLLFLCGVGKTSPINRYNVDIFSYSGPSRSSFLKY